MYKIPANTKFIGKNHIYLPTCHSTNDIAAEISSKVAEGTVVITSHQSKGRGQRGNTWEAEAGANLTFSVIFTPSFLPANEQFYFNMAVALAITDAIASLIPKEGNKLTIKWSNDIYYGHSKLGGILIENTLEGMYLKSSVVGIGLNINQEKFSHPTATSIKNIIGQELRLDEVLEKILFFLEIRYLALKNGAYYSLKKDYMEQLYWYKELHLYKDRGDIVFEGTIIDVKESGRLVIDTKTGVRNFDFKEIIFYE
ncbi:MAG: biotin--[acetyl-CoA-carboxylase] ligase [Cytophagales bacterium]|nr:MAG: biotin--[acetyl-CoA-carboxylase] ligase [Cytophagales bacterium]